MGVLVLRARRPRTRPLPFPELCALWGLPRPTAEYRFSAPRRWRFDWAFVPDRVALEIEGGIWLPGGGRHTRGRGFRRDLEKYNEGIAQGWRILRVLPQDLATARTCDWVRRTLIATGRPLMGGRVQ